MVVLACIITKIYVGVFDFFFLNLHQFPLSFLFPVRNISLEKFTEQLPEIFFFFLNHPR